MRNVHCNWLDLDASIRCLGNSRVNDYVRRSYAAFFFAGLAESQSRATYRHRLFSAGSAERVTLDSCAARMAVNQRDSWYGTRPARLFEFHLSLEPRHRDSRSR
jgi:hypothetical protein